MIPNLVKKIWLILFIVSPIFAFANESENYTANCLQKYKVRVYDEPNWKGNSWELCPGTHSDPSAGWYGNIRSFAPMSIGTVQVNLCELDDSSPRNCMNYYKGVEKISEFMEDDIHQIIITPFNEDDFTMAVISDTQIGTCGSADCRGLSGYTWHDDPDDDDLFKASLIVNINHAMSLTDLKQQVQNNGMSSWAGVILNGDVLTVVNRREQWDKFEELYEPFSIYYGLGNHDYEYDLNEVTTWARPRKINRTVRPGISAQWPHFEMLNWFANKVSYVPYEDFHIERDGLEIDGSMGYSFDIGDWRFIQLNNYPGYNFTLDNNYLGNYVINIEQSYDFLRQQLTEMDSNQKAIINMHYPDVYNRPAFLDILKEFPLKVEAIFAGHEHDGIGFLESFNTVYGVKYYYKSHRFIYNINGNIPVLRSGSAETNQYLKVRFTDTLQIDHMSSINGNAELIDTSFDDLPGAPNTYTLPKMDVKQRTVQLENGVYLTGLDNKHDFFTTPGRGAYRYSIDPPFGSSVEINTFGSSSPNLYVKGCTWPTDRSYTHGGSGIRSVKIDSTAGCTYHILVDKKTFAIRASWYYPDSIQSLVNNTAERIINDNPVHYHKTLRRIYVPADQRLTVKLHNSSNQGVLPELYIHSRNGDNVDATLISDPASSNETLLMVDNISEGDYIIGLKWRHSALGGADSVDLEVSYEDRAISEPVIITNGQTTTINSTKDFTNRFKIRVPQNANLRITTESSFSEDSFFHGDADLFVQFDEPPTNINYDVASTGNTSNEGIRIENTKEGWYHVLVHAEERFLNLGLKATFNQSIDTDIAQSLANGVPVIALHSSQTTKQGHLFKIDVPQGKTLNVHTTGGYGDADIYVRYNRPPTYNRHIANSEGSETVEEITVNDTRGGTYYIWVVAGIKGFYANVTLTASFDGSSGVKILTNGLSESGINSADSTSGAHQFRIHVPAGKTLNVNIHDIYNGSGDADLYVKYASTASAIDYDLASSGSTSTEQVSVHDTKEGYYYISIEAYEGFTYENVLLRASY